MPPEMIGCFGFLLVGWDTQDRAQKRNLQTILPLQAEKMHRAAPDEARVQQKVLSRPLGLGFRVYNRDPDMKALERRGFINHGSTLVRHP